MFGLVGSAATTILNFVLRQVFIMRLGDTLIGVQDLYSEILTMLSLAELGVGTALNYSLYGPVARGEREKIKSYMLMYKKAYRFIAIVIAVIGLALVPFLPWIVKGADYLTLRQLRMYYLLFLFNTVITYFVAYKYSLANAEQRNYIQTNADAVTKAVSVVLQLLGLLVLPNYMLYLLIQVGVSAGQKLFMSIYLDRKYPLLREKDVTELSPEEKFGRDEKFLARHAAPGDGPSDMLFVAVSLRRVYQPIAQRYGVHDTLLAHCRVVRQKSSQAQHGHFNSIVQFYRFHITCFVYK